MLPRIGHRGVAMWSFGLAIFGLVIGAYALGAAIKIKWLIVIGACILM